MPVEMKPHLRLTLSGDLGTTGEVFSCNLSLETRTALWATVMTNVERLALMTSIFRDEIEPDYGDIVDDCVAFWADANTDIHANAVLKRVKLAPIDDEGHYSGAALEQAVTQPGGGGAEAVNCPPWQVSRKITLETDADLGRVKGGFYLPLPIFAPAIFDNQTNLWTAARAAQVRDAVVTFLNNLANSPGFDDINITPVIASTGRHNPDGSVRLPPDNYEIKRVNVGRRPDIQRRRANKVSETRPADAAVAF